MGELHSIPSWPAPPGATWYSWRRECELASMGTVMRWWANLCWLTSTRLASVEDIGLMKLDALLARASRKDFHDLYAICQEVPLKKLMEAASRKYPHTRDFEAMVARRLAYFERADEEEPLPLIQPASWERVKDFFELQAFLFGRSWIE